MKKKSFGIILDFKNLDHFFQSQDLLLKLISKQFENFYLINISYIESKLFKSILFDWDKYSEAKFDPSTIHKLKYENFRVFEPKKLKDLDSFLKEKDMVLINHIDRHFNHFKIWKILKKNNVKQIIISNTSVQDTAVKLPSDIKSKIIFYIGKRLPNKIFTLLGFFNIVGPIDIRFESNIKLANAMKRKKIKKNFFKEIININHRANDFKKKKYHEIKEDYIVLIDANLNHKEDVAIRGRLSESVIKKHYELLNDHLNHLSKIFHKEVVVCIHPQYDLDDTKKNFKNFKVFKYKTQEFIYKSFLVIFYESTSILDAFLLNKKIINLKPDFPYTSLGGFYQKNFDTTLLDLEIDSERRIDKKKLEHKLEKSKKGYKFFLDKYVQTSDSEIGVEKVLRVLKNRYF